MVMVLKIINFYLILINFTGYIFMGVDKNKAIKNKKRIKENTLFNIALAFGSIGVWIGMRKFHHKTKHQKFSIGVPLIAILQIIILIFFYANY